MGRKRISKDGHKLSNLELQHRFQDEASCIDDDMSKAIELIDKKRKARAVSSFRNFVDTYMIGFVLDTKPSEMMYSVIDEMQKALLDNRPVQLSLSRGAGKTTISAIAVLYLLASAKRKFGVIVSQNARSATNILKDIWRMVQEESNFSIDFPELCKPFQLCNGSYRRRQLYKGTSTDIQKTASVIVFPRIKDDNGDDIPTSACAITVRGITSGIRGLKLPNPTGRPDFVLIDDILDAKSAASPEQNEKLLDIIRKDIFNLSSGKKLGVCMTSTPLVADDLTQRLKEDIAWKTIKYPAIIKYPDDMVENPEKGLWAEYWKMFDNENLEDERHDIKGGSLDFYRKHFEEMNKGAKTFDNRFKLEDQHISGLQAILEKKHILGEAAFQSEMQLNPIRASFSLDITPNIVASKMNNFDHLQIPDGFTYVTGAIDLNVSYAMTYCFIAWKRDMTAVVIHHGLYKCNIDSKLSDTAYNQSVYNHLTILVKSFASIGLKIDGIAIDAGGRNWQAVCDFCKNSMFLTGLPCCGFSGRASHQFNPYVRSRLRDSIGRTVLCGSTEERIRSGTGQKYVFFDADFYKEQAQRALLNQVLAAGSLSLYNAPKEEHTEFAIQVCNEKLKFINHKQDGRDYYSWKSKEPHDYLDCLSMNYACATQAGFGSQNFSKAEDTRAQHIRQIIAHQHQKKRLKIV